MFVQIRSWHIVRAHVLATVKTYCGRTVIAKPDTVIVAGLPDDGKTCESCFRVREAQRAADQ